MPVAEAHFSQKKFSYFPYEPFKQRRPLVSTDAGAHGKLEIDPEEAGIVCRIFDRYVAGETTRSNLIFDGR